MRSAKALGAPLRRHVRGNLRTRFALAFAIVAAVVAATVGLLSYHAASERIYQEIDASLRSAATAIENGQTSGLTALATPGRGRGQPSRQATAQFVAPDGTVTSIGTPGARLPVTDTTMTFATGSTIGRSDFLETDVDGESYRILTMARAGGGALQIGVDVEDVEHVLGGMANEIAMVSLVVLVIAAAAGWLLARRITRRLEALAVVAEDISVHGGVDRQVAVQGVDEVGRLSSAFNTMLTRLASARDAQERLIQDAAHELRTPLTSLRTNASVLRRIGDLSLDARTRLVDDVQSETRELSHLVDELVELALARRTDESDESDESVDLAALAHGAARRVTRRTGRQVRVEADRTAVRGGRQGLERAVGNLLENAVKFDGGGAPIEVHIRKGRITVLDRGPGIDADDTARVFDRFYRASDARGLPGSGLGLSIVQDVAQAHGGTVFAGSRPGGGAAVGFTIGSDRLLPGSEPGHVGASPEFSTLKES
jgi:two-component system, OmpR family, sensor histidine kinase MprB